MFKGVLEQNSTGWNSLKDKEKENYVNDIIWLMLTQTEAPCPTTARLKEAGCRIRYYSTLRSFACLFVFHNKIML